MSSDDFQYVRNPSRTRGPALNRRSINLHHEHNDVANPSEQLLSQIDVLELLDLDERPSFIIDLDDPVNLAPGSLRTIFANQALQSSPGLRENICGILREGLEGIGTLSSFPEFKAWILSRASAPSSLMSFPPPFAYASHIWSARTFGRDRRIRVISGVLDTTTTQLEAHRVSVDFPTPTPTDDHIFERSTSDFVTQREMLRRNRSEEPNMQKPRPDSGLAKRHSYLRENVVEKPLSGTTTSSTGVDVTQPELSFAATEEFPPSTMSEKPVDQGFFDWTRLSDSSDLHHHIQFARRVDWASTSLGPMETWSQDLRSMCNLIMNCPFAAAFYWSDDLVAIYNEAYITIAGQKHPQLMGSRYQDVWSEIWTQVEGTFAKAKTMAVTTAKEDDCLHIMRDGFLEETYFSWSIIPLIGAEGSVVGYYNPAFEKTRKKLAERRMYTLREIGEQTAAARDLKSFWKRVLKGMEYNERDAPFVILYSVADEAESDGSSIQSNSVFGVKQCTLEGTLGVPSGHPAAPSHIDLKSSVDGFAPSFREAMKRENPVVLQTEDGSLPPHLLEGIQFRGYEEPCQSAVVCPINPTTGDSILGFLVIGVNQRKKYDEDYSLFIQILKRQLATAIASVVLFEEEIRRNQRAAKLAAEDRIALSNQLAARTQEAAESENRFTRLAELALVGMFIADSQGRMTFCNDTWYDVSRHSREEKDADRWMDSIKDEDKQLVQQFWENLLEKKLPASVEFRFKTPWHDKKGNASDTWVLCAAYPEKDHDGDLKSVFGCLTDISHQKQAEGIQRHRMEEAVELKRQQENFIDITSHEMRNPLSAILQCADDITTTLTDLKVAHTFDDEAAAEEVDSCVEAAQTIFLSARHAHRMINDTLTVSKLDSSLLLVTPVDVEPEGVAQKALRMFEREAQTAGVRVDLVVEKSFSALAIEWVRLDPSRLLQVLINLITNAIKFTSDQNHHPTVTISLGASVEMPSNRDDNGVSYFPSIRKQSNFLSQSEWGKGEVLYLQFAVRDTGRGLTESEMKLLFQRFSQASSLTHITYGGSGLGLYISRQLVELQGGQIGVSSTSGEGSTFAFWIQARRSSPPAEGSEHSSAATSRKSSLATVPTARLPPKSISLKKTAPLTYSPKMAAATTASISILVVEDNLVNSKVLAKQLQKNNFGVVVANHGGEALDILRQSRHWQSNSRTFPEIDLILMDVEMPVMDGLTCTRRIRELEKAGSLTKKFPIVCVTANARAEQIDFAIEMGADDVVSKPFTIRELLAKVDALVKRGED